MSESPGDHISDEQISTVIDGLSDVAVLQHVESCAQCSNRRADMASLRNRLEVAPLPSAVRDEMIATAVSSFNQVPESHHWWQSTRGLGVAAAVVLLVAIPAVVVQSNRSESKPSSPAAQLQAADASGSRDLSGVFATLSSKATAQRSADIPAEDSSYDSKSLAETSGAVTATTQSCQQQADAIANKHKEKIVTEAIIPWTTNSDTTSSVAYGLSKSGEPPITRVVVFNPDTCAQLATQNFNHPNSQSTSDN